MADLIEFYRILGIDPASAPEEITAARDELTRVWNPERFPSDDRIRRMAAVKIAEINAAHDVLMANLNVGMKAEMELEGEETDSSLTGNGNSGCEACGNLPVKAEQLYCSFCGARNLIETESSNRTLGHVDCRLPSRNGVLVSKQNSQKKKSLSSPSRCAGFI